MNNGLSQLIEKHITTLQTDGARLFDLLKGEPCDLEATRVLSHTLKGAAGSLGFREYAQACQEIESQCKEFLQSGRDASPADWNDYQDVLLNISLEDSELYQRMNA